MRRVGRERPHQNMIFDGFAKTAEGKWENVAGATAEKSSHKQH